MGPDGGLSGLIDETLQHTTSDAVDTKPTVDGVEAVVASLLRKDRVEDTTLLSALARLDVAGTGIDWTPIFHGRGASRVQLPTYAFDRQQGGRHASSSSRITSEEVQDLFARKLAQLSLGDQWLMIKNAVRDQLAAVSGKFSPDEFDEDNSFRDLGLDSLGAVEFRRRLNRLTGVAMSATLIFDYPTPRAVAEHLHQQLAGASVAAEPVVVMGHSAEPIAIVGVGCRFPGGVSSREELWQVVAQGRDVVSQWPLDRGWDAGLFDPEPGVAGRSYTREGGFLHDAGLFDAGFFGISPREAVAMDPQQRLLLETVWEALEDAGVDPVSLRGSDTGVFIGVTDHAYGIGRGEVDDSFEGYRLTGTTSSVVSGRVSYVLGLEGPAVSVDTACSSSLVALHQAVQAVRAGECGMALVGGVTVMST
ncbi:beta-ketoacyl synthase N-terminal-like domain-containing protein, partial [Nocardia vinacea]|uniref:beta-ketoacyl synthase N-terminal-like domain-containing protein n=1 Tax=Nocardia vinacea TaxID=96468 RepID=UPI0040328969